MDLVWALLALTLVGSAFLAQRVPWGQAARMALAWIAIFGVVIIVYSQRDSFARIWRDVSRDLIGGGQEVRGDTVRIARSPDGHFWANVTINGRSLRMLVDSGATSSALSIDTARSLGIDVADLGSPVIIGTANGDIEAYRVRMQHMQLGSITAEDLPAVVSPAFGDTSVIGMNFLSRLDRWSVEGTTLVLEPPTGGTGRQ